MMSKQKSSEHVEVHRSKGIYLLPNLFTTSGLFAGFYAIVAAMRDDFEKAAIAVFIAMVMDGLDGRVARLTNTQSAFGAEYDSLADIVSFGIAPSLVVYSWGLASLGKPGWLVAFFFAAATALRLARFNSRIGVEDKRYFQGLPCPSAAGLVAGMVWVAHDYGVPGQKLWVLAAIVTLITGALMVSSFRYYSFKDIDLKGHVPFVAVLAFLIIFVCVSIYPPLVLLVGFSLYVLSGPFMSARRRYLAWRKSKRHVA
ncbi:MAG: CDP-diacylglycerol--serine O-phosphatidyltransferase [Gammaproteobacteria bacterium 39-13]|nr:MAG: CDP-diacylglycerol--serine O-phosphatidyltransferase [Gammaproteobacteria bacterium 39-13]